jgi:hypothetical protein
MLTGCWQSGLTPCPPGEVDETSSAAACLAEFLPDTGAAFVEDDAINLDSHRYTQSSPNDCRWVAAVRLE